MATYGEIILGHGNEHVGKSRLHLEEKHRSLPPIYQSPKSINVDKLEFEKDPFQLSIMSNRHWFVRQHV
jgi:hypothetical protein